jgi:hypothetical protein
MSNNNPKLKNKAILALLFHSTRSIDEELESKRRFRCGILTNQKYLNAFFNDNKVNCIQLYVTSDEFELFSWLENSRFPLEYCSIKAKLIAALIKVSNVERLSICSAVYGFNEGLIQGWLQICRALKGSFYFLYQPIYSKFLESKTLKQLELRMDCPRDGYNRFIFEQLPDKIVELNTDPEIWSTLKGKECVMNSMSLFVQQMNLCKTLFTAM